MLLESDAASKGKGSTKWDQFAANQQLFGTATSYNEDLYTTKLDKGASAISVQEAERLAAEIQGGTTSNCHMAEERGALTDSGVGILLSKPMQWCMHDALCTGACASQTGWQFMQQLHITSEQCLTCHAQSHTRLVHVHAMSEGR